MKLDPKVFGPCLALGISSFVMISTESLLSISFTSSLARYGGDVAVGAMTIITSVNQLITMPLQGICQGGQPIISYNFGAGNKDRVKKAFFTQLFCVRCIYHCRMVSHDDCTTAVCRFIYIRYEPSRLHFMGTSHLYGGYILNWFSSELSAKLYGTWPGEGKSAFGMLKEKIVLLIPLIFILPCFLADKVFAVFLAEPISDILAATVTTITFLTRFDKILEVGVQVKKR